MPNNPYKKESPQWLNDADAGKTVIRNPDGSISTVRTVSWDSDGRYFVAPTIRLRRGKPVQLSEDEAIQEAMRSRDAMPFNSREESDNFARALHNRHSKLFGNKAYAE